MNDITMTKKLYQIILPIVFLLGINLVMAQETSLVQIKTFDLSLNSISNLELSFDNNNYFNTGSNGSIIVEINNTLLPPKVIYFRDNGLEAESWNYSQGILEIIVRKKSFETYQVTVLDDNGEVLKNVVLKLDSELPIEGTTNSQGGVQLSIPLSLNLQRPEQFKINGYNIVGSDFSGNTGIITAALIPPVIIPQDTPPPEISQPIVEINELHLDSLNTLTTFWSYIRGIDMTNLSDDQKKLIDNKFSEVYTALSDSLDNISAITGKISDSTLVVNDIIFLTEQAILESRSISRTREEFNEEIGRISEKITDGGGNLSDESRDDFLAQLARLDGLLVANEILFAQNQSYFKESLNDLKNKLLNIEDLEKQLSDAELQRLAEQEIFQRRLLIILGVSFGLLLLLFLFIYLIRKVSKQKKELVIAHEVVKNTNDNLENLVAKRTKTLRRVNKELDTFLYKSSHDLKRPLTTILGLANVAKITLNDEANELFEKTRQTADEMNKLLVKLLTISEINEPAEHSAIHFQNIINQLDAEFKETIEKNKISVAYKIAKNIEYQSNTKLVECILRNLFENALLYVSLSERKKPRVEISIYREGAYLRIKVSDNGSGISTDIKSKVWNMFYRGNARSTGNGLGLYIARRAVGVLKGKISFETISGEYTKFNVQLPIIDKKVIKSTKTTKNEALEAA
jgi:signal transduction histidine kinase